LFGVIAVSLATYVLPFQWKEVSLFQPLGTRKENAGPPLRSLSATWTSEHLILVPASLVVGKPQLTPAAARAEAMKEQVRIQRMEVMSHCSPRRKIAGSTFVNTVHDLLATLGGKFYKTL
jgi:hypothetical protein